MEQQGRVKGRGESESSVPTHSELLAGMPECCLPPALSWGLSAQPLARRDGGALAKCRSSPLSCMRGSASCSFFLRPATRVPEVFVASALLTRQLDLQDTNELIYKIETDSDLENKFMVTKRERWRG